MFKTFPRECGPPRKVVYNLKEWIDFVNKYNGLKKAVYTSIYMFENIFDNKKPDYESAVIDKLFFDFDDKSCDAYKECNTLHQYLLKEDIKHCIIMSGRGYHLYVFVEVFKPENIKSYIYNSQHHFIDTLNLSVDVQVIGNPAQLARVPNTFNGKGKRFCIPLTREQFEKGDEFIKELANKQNFVTNISIGNKLFDISKFDYVADNIEDFEFEVDIETSHGNYMNDSPPFIKSLLTNKNLGWNGRYLLILYFKEIGFTKEEVFNILKNTLSPTKFNHCVVEERQLQYLFGRHDLVFPNIHGINLYK